MTSSTDIVKRALEAATVEDATKLQDAIAASFRGRFERPLGDRYQNLGMLGSGGSFDQKLIEQVTNMQDAVIERLALQQWNSRDSVPYKTPFHAAEDLFADLSEDEKVSMAFGPLRRIRRQPESIQAPHRRLP